MIESTQGRQSLEKWSVSVIYDGPQTRERAMRICDDLIQQFWTEVEFELHWWCTDFVEDVGMSHAALSEASGADILILCSNAGEEFPESAAAWLMNLARQRSAEFGALIDLTEYGDVPTPTMAHKRAFLQQFAHEARLDYLTGVPNALRGPLPESLETVEMRAARMTTVLDEILHYPAPARFGLNE